MGEIGLAMVRNVVSRGIYRQQERATLEMSLLEARNSDSPFRELLVATIETALADAEAGNLDAAYAELQLGHNIPESATAAAGWSDNWFYVGDIPGYISRVRELEVSNKVDRIGRLIRLVAIAQNLINAHSK